MKRIAILGFIVFVVPVWIVSCNRCGKDGPFPWTWTRINLHPTNTFDGTPLIGDTVKTDSVHYKFLIIGEGVSLKQKNETSAYSAIACDPASGDQKNRITKLILGLGSLNSIDTSINSSLIINYERINYEWVKNEESFIVALSNKDAINSGYAFAKFSNPHNSKPVQIIIMAIKENGDTLKAASEEIVLK